MDPIASAPRAGTRDGTTPPRRWDSGSLGGRGPRETRLPTTDGGYAAVPRSSRRSPRSAEDVRTLEESEQLARLRGVTQVFDPATGATTREQHAHDVADLAAGLAAELGLDDDLARAIALGHDCGHAPFGHAGEEAVRLRMPSFSHGPWAADVALRPLDLSPATLAGIRDHSWYRPAPEAPEAHVVRWADRVAYCTRDRDDAIALGIVDDAALPAFVAETVGCSTAEQRAAFRDAILRATTATGVVAMNDAEAVALAELRLANSRQIYSHPLLDAKRLAQIDTLLLVLDDLLDAVGASVEDAVARVMRLDDDEAASLADAVEARAVAKPLAR